VEAVVEDLDVKTEIFAALDKIVGPDALISSNTSSLPIMRLAAATDRPERVIRPALLQSGAGNAAGRNHSV
jgi:3-hydroxybutyryl-CoA dehydrogenase